MSDEKKASQEVGALWKSDKPGPIVMTGQIHGEKVVVFANIYKVPGDKKPDFRIVKARTPDTARPADDDIGF